MRTRVTKWDGKVCVITGAAAGIGRRLAERLLAEGATVAAWDVDELGLRSLADEASKYGWDCITDKVDVTSEMALREARDRVLARTKRLDSWWNIAGISTVAAFVELDAAKFERIISVNLWGVIRGTRVALETMEVQGSGLVVNFSSVAGFVAPPYLCAYATAKHAVVGFTRSLREELGLRDSPVGIVMVAPGFVDTAMVMSSGLEFPDWLQWTLARPETVAQEILTGLAKGHDEIFPAANGRWLLRASRLFPRWTVRRSRWLLAKTWKDLLLNRYSVR